MLPAIGSAGLSIDEVAARLAGGFGGDLVDVRVQEPDTVVAQVDRGRLHDVAVRLRGLDELAYESCNFVAAVDLGGPLETVYHLYSFASNTYLELQKKIQAMKIVAPRLAPDGREAGDEADAPTAVGDTPAEAVVADEVEV